MAPKRSTKARTKTSSPTRNPENRPKSIKRRETHRQNIPTWHLGRIAGERLTTSIFPRYVDTFVEEDENRPDGRAPRTDSR